MDRPELVEDPHDYVLLAGKERIRPTTTGVQVVEGRLVERQGLSLGRTTPKSRKITSFSGPQRHSVALLKRLGKPGCLLPVLHEPRFLANDSLAPVNGHQRNESKVFSAEIWGKTCSFGERADKF